GIRIAMLAGALVAGAMAWMPDARACGGCFHEAPPPGAPPPPPETASVITDHRMVLVLDSKHTTLYDQVEYSGDPKEFAWVLPVRGEVVVGVGSDAFVDSLDAMTAPVILAPPPTCPRTSSSGGGSSYGGANGTGCGVGGGGRGGGGG